MPYPSNASSSRGGPRRPYVGAGGFPKSGKWVARPGYGRPPAGIRKFMKPKANAFGASKRGHDESVHFHSAEPENRVPFKSWSDRKPFPRRDDFVGARDE